MTSSFFKLHSANIVVRGREKSAIYKLNKGKILFVPNSLAALITELEKYPIGIIRERYNGNEKETFESYIRYLLQEDVGFLTDTPELFPSISMEYAIPSIINNAIIEVDLMTTNIFSALDQLQKMHCKHLEARFSLNDAPLKSIKEFLSQLKDSSFRSISMLVNYEGKNVEVAELNELYDSMEKIDFMMIHNFAVQDFNENDRNIFFHTDPNVDLLSMTFPKDKYIINIEFFVESLQYNPYYNKKVCIDRSGKIKNCLLHENFFGNINDNNLQAVVESEAFQELWNASHDKIIELKWSELRYCTLLSNNLKKIGPEAYSLA